MMGFEPDDTGVRNNHNGHKPDAIDEQDAPMSDALTTDAAAWRAEQAPTARRIEQRLAASLRSWSAASDDFRVSALKNTNDREVAMDTETARESDSQELEFENMSGSSKIPQAPHRPRTLGAVAVAAVVLIGLVSTLVALRGGLSGTGSGHTVAPTTTHNGGKAPGVVNVTGIYVDDTPAQELKDNLVLTPCLKDPGATAQAGAPPQATYTSWIEMQSTFAMAFVHITCLDGHHPVAIVSLQQQHDGTWSIHSALVGALEDTPKAPNTTPWVTLPSGSYDTFTETFPVVSNQDVAMNYIYWASDTHAYILDHVAIAAQPMPGATSITVNGRTAWVTQSNGDVTITDQLANGTSLFFSGTGSVPEIEAIAVSALTHANDILPTLDTTPGQAPTYTPMPTYTPKP